MNAARLEEIGTVVFGMWWQSEIARIVGKSPRAIRYWMSGARTIPEADAERIMSVALAKTIRSMEVLGVLRSQTRGN